MEAGSCKDSVMLTRLFRAAFAMIVSVYLPLSNQATVRAADPARPPGGIEWSQQKTAESGIDGAALESLYSEVAGSHITI